jgi:hypothetical protein
MITNYRWHGAPELGDRVVIISVDDYDNSFTGRTGEIIEIGNTFWPAWHYVKITGFKHPIWLCVRQLYCINLVSNKN